MSSKFNDEQPCRRAFCQSLFFLFFSFAFSLSLFVSLEVWWLFGVGEKDAVCLPNVVFGKQGLLFVTLMMLHAESVSRRGGGNCRQEQKVETRGKIMFVMFIIYTEN